MNRLLDAIYEHARLRPEHPAIEDGMTLLSYRDLVNRVDVLAAQLSQSEHRTLGLLADNSSRWICVDLAALAAGVTLVPIPAYFTVAQRQHCIESAGITAILSESSGSSCDSKTECFGDSGFALCATAANPVLLPADTAKITYTSGSTASPKGVCLSAATMSATAGGICDALNHLQLMRHLCVLPLAVLLENVAGVYSTLLRGDTLVLCPLRELGIGGSSSLEVERLRRVIERDRPASMILLPQMLKQLVESCSSDKWRPPRELRFVATGGARVAPELIARAHAHGIPAFEGYGLSECGSVVALNLPDNTAADSVGRVLPHCRVEIVDGEIVIDGKNFLGYVGNPSPVHSRVRSGDLGEFDSNGFLHVTGREKNLLISSFGRNISPEWPESELLASPLITQCMVVGDAKPCCSALLWAAPGASDAALQRWIDRVNERLPDYARIHHFRRLPEPMTPDNGLLTASGKTRRDVVASRHGNLIEHMYATANHPATEDQPMTDQSTTDFYQTLMTATETARAELTSNPFMLRGVRGALDLTEYIAFLTEAYHHVKHTVPLLMACGSRLPSSKEWLREAIAEYIEEETGHQEWVLNDIAAAGGDADAVRHGQPASATELMVAYAYDIIQRGNPVGFFGMVHVLEGTSVAVADTAAGAIRQSLGLPNTAFSYLRSHGALDIEHVAFFEQLMNRINQPDDQSAIIHCANMFYRLYADIFTELQQHAPEVAEQAA